jgi:hypothetical protein
MSDESGPEFRLLAAQGAPNATPTNNHGEKTFSRGSTGFCHTWFAGDDRAAVEAEGDYR